MPLTKLANEQGYLKAGFLGYQKSGKSFTAALLAIGTRKFFGLKGPIAFFDTESGSGYIAEMVKKETGTDLMGVRERSFAALMQFAQDCINEKVSIAIIDSITHPWRELMDSYLVQVNEKRRDRNLYALQKLEFQHWSAIKNIWQPWSDFYLNSPLHIIVCGRAGAIWEMEKNEESGRKELTQVGTKMKVEGEFGFEPSLLIEMEREQRPDGKGGFKIFHTATVIGDRFNKLDGAVETNPTFEFFKPHVEQLKAGSHAPVNVSSRTQTGADLEGSGDWEREKKQRQILCEEIQGVIVSQHPGQSAEEKKAKADLMQQFFGTRSWTKVESMDSVSLRKGLAMLQQEFGELSNTETEEEEDDVPMGNTETKPESGEVNIPAVRSLMGAKKIIESRFLGMLAELGTVPKGLETFEEAEKAQPGTMQRIIEEWGPFSKAYLESQKS